MGGQKDYSVYIHTNWGLKEYSYFTTVEGIAEPAGSWDISFMPKIIIFLFFATLIGHFLKNSIKLAI